MLINSNGVTQYSLATSDITVNFHGCIFRELSLLLKKKNNKYHFLKQPRETNCSSWFKGLPGEKGRNWKKIKF